MWTRVEKIIFIVVITLAVPAAGWFGPAPALAGPDAGLKAETIGRPAFGAGGFEARSPDAFPRPHQCRCRPDHGNGVGAKIHAPSWRLTYSMWKKPRPQAPAFGYAFSRRPPPDLPRPRGAPIFLVKSAFLI